MPQFNPARGGHAPGHLREMFCVYVETGAVPIDELNDPSVIGRRDSVVWLCGQLWNCTDQLPAELVTEMDNQAHTYGQAVRMVRRRHSAPTPL